MFGTCGYMAMAKSIDIKFVLIPDRVEELSNFIDLNRHMIIDLDDQSNCFGIAIVNLSKFL